MEKIFNTIEVKSLKEACLHQLERIIFSGELEVGSQLPSERQLAGKLGVSRPVLHQALVQLEAKGLVRIEPRKGVFINDYRQAGSIAMLASFLSYHQDEMDESFLENLLDFRKLLEVETACLTANYRTDEHLDILWKIYEEETARNKEDVELLTQMDFSFHMQVAHASGNLIYPLILNSFKEVYTSFTRRFFDHYCGSDVIDEVYQYHVRLIADIEKKDERQAGTTMIEMLEHGASYMRAISETT